MSEKTVKKKRAPRKQKSRAKYVCPPELEKFIDWARLVPANAELESSSEIEKRLQEKLSVEYDQNRKPVDEEKYNAFLIEWFEECYKQLPEGYIDPYFLTGIIWFIKDNDGQHLREKAQDALLRLINEYETYRQIRHQLYDLVRGLEEDRNLKLGRTTFDHDPLPTNSMDFFIPTSIQIQLPPWNSKIYISTEPNKDGEQIIKVDMPVQRFADALKGVYADRLRLCTICERVYWAKRKESETCSRRCLNNLWQRKFRENQKKAEKPPKTYEEVTEGE